MSLPAELIWVGALQRKANAAACLVSPKSSARRTEDMTFASPYKITFLLDLSPQALPKLSDFLPELVGRDSKSNLKYQNNQCDRDGCPNCCLCHPDQEAKNQ